MASAAARSCTRRIFRACIPPTSGCARSMASPTTGRSTTATLEPFFAENDRMMGVSGLAGDPGLSAEAAADAAVAARQVRRALGQGDEQARLALVALRLHDRHRPITMAGRAASISATARRAARRAPRPAPTSPTGRRRSAPASSCARAAGCAKSPPTSTAWPPARLLRRRRRRAVPARRGRHRRLQRHRHAAPAAEFRVGAVPERAGQFQRPGRQEPDVAPLCAASTAMPTSRRTAIAVRRCACGARSSTRPMPRAVLSAAIRGSSAAAWLSRTAGRHGHWAALAVGAFAAAPVGHGARCGRSRGARRKSAPADAAEAPTIGAGRGSCIGQTRRGGRC